MRKSTSASVRSSCDSHARELTVRVRCRGGDGEDREQLPACIEHVHRAPKRYLRCVGSARIWGSQGQARVAGAGGRTRSCSQRGARRGGKSGAHLREGLQKKRRGRPSKLQLLRVRWALSKTKKRVHPCSEPSFPRRSPACRDTQLKTHTLLGREKIPHAPPRPVGRQHGVRPVEAVGQGPVVLRGHGAVEEDAPLGTGIAEAAM